MTSTLRQRSGRLPEAVTSFVGRRTARADVRRLLEGSRLVTLTGVGGVGKTRLALQVARDVRRAFPDGVWLAELAKLDDDSLVDSAVAAALELSDSSGRALIDVLVDYLADKRLLVVLDNCEHLLPACARLTSRLLSEAPELRVLATSRDRLAIGAEQVWLVPPLSVPEPDSLTSGTARQYEAMTLFEDRASSVLPGFRLGPENEAAVARLCRQLDGLPLAIELAAGLAEGVVGGTDPGSVVGSVRHPDERRPNRGGAAPDAAGSGGVELRPVSGAGADVVGQVLGVLR
ncbi:ATP-binding protein [Kribbella sp. NPDC050124]|uniref:ATP-binding protein n=1 Tax=Kribbella sp. NPDC050124 TaxID=3364114 RepID=UPI0037BC1EAA